MHANRVSQFDITIGEVKPDVLPRGRVYFNQVKLDEIKNKIKNNSVISQSCLEMKLLLSVMIEEILTQWMPAIEEMTKEKTVNKIEVEIVISIS